MRAFSLQHREPLLLLPVANVRFAAPFATTTAL
jgi:hypothetical protein